MGEKVLSFRPQWHMSASEAWEIAKCRLDDDTLPVHRKVQAIEIVARFETVNSVTKDELQKMLRWLFEHYDFEG